MTPHNLITVYVIQYNIYNRRTASSVTRLCDVQGDRGLCCPYISEDTFSHGMPHIHVFSRIYSAWLHSAEKSLSLMIERCSFVLNFVMLSRSHCQESTHVRTDLGPF